MLTRTPSLEESRGTRPRRVLVIADDPGIRHLIWMVLREAGLAVATASNTAEAQARMQHELFWLLVTDHDMPRETGLDFVQRLRRGDDGLTGHQDVPVIMVSALDAPDHLTAVSAAGINALVQKPFRPDALTRVVRGLVEGGANDDEVEDFIHVSTFN